MCMLPKKQRMYPLHVVVLSTAKVLEFIGLICYKYANEPPDQPLKCEFLLKNCLHLINLLSMRNTLLF